MSMLGFKTVLNEESDGHMAGQVKFSGSVVNGGAGCAPA